MASRMEPLFGTYDEYEARLSLATSGNGFFPIQNEEESFHQYKRLEWAAFGLYPAAPPTTCLHRCTYEHFSGHS
jgi:hypothetical protein